MGRRGGVWGGATEMPVGRPLAERGGGGDLPVCMH
jgi:hypothetical protein